MLVDDEPTDDRPDGRTTASGCPERAGTAGEDTAAGVVPEAPGKVDGTGEAAAAAWEALELEVVDVLSLIHISEPTRPVCSSRMPSSA